jgi:hypothetical protein
MSFPFRSSLSYMSTLRTKFRNSSSCFCRNGCQFHAQKTWLNLIYKSNVCTYITYICTYTHIRRALVQRRGWGNGAFFSCWVHLEYSPSEDRRKSTALPLSHAIAGRISKTCRFTLGHVEIWASSLVSRKIHQFYIINSHSQLLALEQKTQE